MLNITATDIDNNNIILPSPKSITINQEIEVPADDVTITFLLVKNLPELKTITVKDEDKIVFMGVVDEQQTIFDEKSAYTKIIGRSLAALLLDNESKPINYTNPATSVIFEKHLKPLGFTKYAGDDVTLYTSLNIVKGSTNWQAFYTFCVNAFGCFPRIEADGTANFSGSYNKGSVFFSNAKGIRFNSLKENLKRCIPISEVKVKTSPNSGYDVNFVNEDAVNKGIKRIRYIDVTNGVTTIETASKIIDNSIKASYEITLICPSCLLDILGAKATVEDSNIGLRDNLYVSSVHYTLNNNGEFTTIKLKKEY